MVLSTHAPRLFWDKAGAQVTCSGSRVHSGRSFSTGHIGPFSGSTTVGVQGPEAHSNSLSSRCRFSSGSTVHSGSSAEAEELLTGEGTSCLQPVEPQPLMPKSERGSFSTAGSVEKWIDPAAQRRAGILLALSSLHILP